VSGIPQPWWPFPSRHSSALEIHTHRVSSINTRDTSNIESIPSPPPKLQGKRHRRKLSAEYSCNEPNSLNALTTTKPLQEQKPPGQRRHPLTRTEAALLQQEELWSEEKADQVGAGNGFLYPQPAAPMPVKLPRAQQLRQDARRAHARKEKPLRTVYKTFDEAAFGKRSSPPPYLRRRSLLSIELTADDDKSSESGEPSPIYLPLRLDGSQSACTLAWQTWLLSSRSRLGPDLLANS
jgi:hypothetical protein